MLDLAERFCATVCLVARYRHQNNTNLWPRILDVLCREASHPIGWTQDSKALYIYRLGEVPAKVYRLDLGTGQRTLWKQLMPADPAGVSTIGPILITPDGKTYVYGFHRTLADLYLVEGLK